MFRRKNYSQKSLSVFEIVSSFVVNLYYNHLYHEAQSFKIAGKVESLTDGYKHAIKAYLQSLNNPTQYKKTIRGIHKYYSATTRYNMISFAECINEIVSHFIPEDFFETTSNPQRDGLLRKVYVNSVKQFSSEVLCTGILNTIIDNHSDITIVRIMQDKMVCALMFEREKLFQEIFNTTNRPSDNKNMTIVMKMKIELKKFVKENHELVTKYNKLKDNALKLISMAKLQKRKIEELEEKLNNYNAPSNDILAQTEYTHNNTITEQHKHNYERNNGDMHVDELKKQSNQEVSDIQNDGNSIIKDYKQPINISNRKTTDIFANSTPFRLSESNVNVEQAVIPTLFTPKTEYKSVSLEPAKEVISFATNIINDKPTDEELYNGPMTLVETPAHSPVKSLVTSVGHDGDTFFGNNID
jgi:hypothetical protein